MANRERVLLGKHIMEARKEREMTQERLGLMVGVGRTYISEVEKGRRNITVDNLMKISKGLNVSLEHLFRDM